MKKVYKNILELIGHTPLLEITTIEEVENLQAKVYVKLESFNPGGSVKDRVALKMIEDLESQGKLKEEATIIEATSGNTGIGLAMVAAAKGYKTIFTMPETMSEERRRILQSYGAKIVLTDGKLGMKGAIQKAKELEKEIDHAIILGQFTNPSNPKAHYETTGREIWEDTEGVVDIFVAGVGTGGTITGTGKYLKEQNQNIEIVAVEPEKSPVLSGGKAGPHSIQGIGAGFVPDILDTEIYDRIYKIETEQAYKGARMLANREGVLVGISSGAAVYAAIEEAKKDENAGKVIVVLLADTGERYLSTELFKSI
ncbi:cysteine synthase A [Faecalimonas sp.]